MGELPVSWNFHCGDCLEVIRTMPADSVDLCMFSPPYEDARTYGIGFNLRGEEYVAWMMKVFGECARVCRGLIACVIEGKTTKFRWSATPALLMADLHGAGFNLRKPPIFRRVGIPGSGGPDWLRNDYEFIICVTRKGKLPYSDNTACGHEPKYQSGGAASHRLPDGRRIGNKTTTCGSRGKEGKLKLDSNGYIHPHISNPGNIISVPVGCGLMGGDEYASQNEAPFPEKLVEFFIKSFCPPGGTVLDPFSGSGTTVAVADRLGRNGIGIDIRQSQIDLATRRCAEQGKLVMFDITATT